MEQQLERLQQDYHDLNASVVPVLPYPNAIQFCKQVSKGRPCVYQLPKVRSIEWPALSWSLENILSRVKAPVEVAVTPGGNADSLIPHPKVPNERLFVEPAIIHLTVKDLVSKLTSISGDRTWRSSEAAYYLQSQNSNLTSTPLSSLLQDLQLNFDFAGEILGEPDARNIWIGDERSVTSTHRDPYENLYLVLKGQKTFRLWAPVDEVSMPIRMVPTGRYTYAELHGEPRFDVQVNDSCEQIPWVDLDPLIEQASIYGNPIPAKTGHVHQVTVGEGQILFLPAGWYHHVSQKCGRWSDGSKAPCIAVNYWYDQDYESDSYILRQLVSNMVEATRKANLDHQRTEFEAFSEVDV